MKTSNRTYKYSTSFYLVPDKNQVYLHFTFSGKRVRIYTKENITPTLWDANKQRAKETTRNPNYGSTNANLNAIENKIKEVFENFINHYERQPSTKELREIFRKEYFEKIPQFTSKEPKSLLEVFEEYIETKKIENTPRTAEKYIQARNNLIEFGQLKREQIQFENITNDFRIKLIKFFKEDKKFAQSTIYRKMNFIKTILNYALANNYIDKLDINLSNWSTRDGKGKHIALSEQELEEIEELDLSNDNRLEHVRDRFLIGCYTGMRFSDFMRLNKNHIQDGKYIIISQKKTEDNITIPFFEEVKSIFEKYDYNLPRPISMQRFNKYIKEVAKLCPSLRRLQEFNGEKPIPRNELISSHTARRTFVTLNASRGIDLETLTYATGHTTVKSLKNYLKLDNKQKADIIGNAFKHVESKEKERDSKGKVIDIKSAN